MQAIVESFEGSGILVTQAKVSLQTTGLATLLLKIEEQLEYQVKLIETIESAKYTVKEVICSINGYIQKRMQNNGISKIMNMERPDI